jgi:hypothetical protein
MSRTRSKCFFSFKYENWHLLIRTGWPDEFVKKLPKMSPNPLFVKINAQLIHLEKEANDFALFL